jgi:hypothetical protein
MDKSLKLIQLRILKAMALIIGFLIIDLIAWYYIFANYNIALYSFIFGGFIAFGVICGLILIAVLIYYKWETELTKIMESISPFKKSKNGC